jgi:hypothetical protein
MNSFTNDNTLIVPIDVKALAVNDSFKSKKSRRWRMNFFQINRFANPEPDAFQGDIEEDFYDQEENQGIYLHWMVPSALREGIDDKEKNELVFKPLPNRWLIVRVYNGHVRKWLIKSDEINISNEYGSTFAYIKDNALQVSQLGMSYPIKASFDAEDSTFYSDDILKEELSSFKAQNIEFPKSLNALGFGDPQFLAYQPLVQDVFSFHDDLSTLKKANLPIDGIYNYLIAGWYSDSNDDSLIPEEDQKIDQLLESYKWNLKDVDLAAILPKLNRSLYYGKIINLNFNDSSFLKGSADTAVRVSFGHNPIDAFIALIKDKASPQLEPIINYLEAFQYGELPLLNLPGGDEDLKQEKYTKWFKPKPSNIYWVIEKESTEDIVLDLNAEMQKLLQDLNTKQFEMDTEIRNKEMLQKIFYQAWWNLNSSKYVKGSDYIALEAEIKKLKEGDLGKKIKDIQQKIEGEEKVIEGIKDKINLALTELNSDNTAESSKEKIENFKLHYHSDTSFYEMHDPSILITGVTKEEFTPEESLTCLIPSQLQTGNLGNLTDSTMPADILNKLFGHFVSEMQAGKSEWNQTWDPMFIEWEAEWFTLPFQEGEERYWNYDENGFRLEWNEQQRNQLREDARGYLISGRSFITPHNNEVLSHQLKNLMDNTEDEKKADLAQLKEFVEALTKNKFLSESLTNFNRKINMQNNHINLLPEDPDTLELIGEQYSTQPLDLAELPYALTGMQQGQFKINKLYIYDQFGQCLIHVGAGGTFGEEHFDPVKDVAMNVVQEKAIQNLNPDRFVEIKPHISEYARLNFNFVDSKDTAKLLHRDLDTNPICGWVIHNHLDRELILFDNEGNFLNEIKFSKEKNSVEIFPKELVQTDNAFFNAFINRIPTDAEGYEYFLTTIDETLWNIDPTLQMQSAQLAVWMGKPLAVVRTKLLFEQYGSSDELLPAEVLPFANNINPLYLKQKQLQFKEYEFDVKIGNAQRLKDGLIGYFNDNLDDKIFYSISAPDGDSRFIKKIGETNYLKMKFEVPAEITLLMDPMAEVTANCGILPATKLTLPHEFVHRALKNMKLEFRFHSLLTVPERAVKEGEKDRFGISTPALSKGDWEWVEQFINENGEGVESTFGIVDVPRNANMDYISGVLRDGRLKVGDVLEDGKDVGEG